MNPLLVFPPKAEPWSTYLAPDYGLEVCCFFLSFTISNESPESYESLKSFCTTTGWTIGSSLTGSGISFGFSLTCSLGFAASAAFLFCLADAFAFGCSCFFSCFLGATTISGSVRSDYSCSSTIFLTTSSLGFLVLFFFFFFFSPSSAWPLCAPPASWLGSLSP